MPSHSARPSERRDNRKARREDTRRTHVLYGTPSPLLEPETDYERSGLVSNVVFPSATDLRSDGDLDVYYGAADHAVAAARIAMPSRLKDPTFELLPS